METERTKTMSNWSLLMKGTCASLTIATVLILFLFWGLLLIHRYNKLYRHCILYTGHPFANLVDAYFSWTVAFKYSIRLTISNTVVLSACVTYYYLKTQIVHSIYDDLIGTIVGWALPLLMVQLIALLNILLFNATFQNPKHDLLVSSIISILILVLTDFNISFKNTALITGAAFLLNIFLSSLLPWKEAKEYIVEKILCAGVYFAIIFALHVLNQITRSRVIAFHIS